MTEATPETPVTGHPTVDEAIRRVAALDDAPLAEEAVAFEDAHTLLRRALTETAPGEVTAPDVDPTA